MERETEQQNRGASVHRLSMGLRRPLNKGGGNKTPNFHGTLQPILNQRRTISSMIESQPTHVAKLPKAIE